MPEKKEPRTEEAKNQKKEHKRILKTKERIQKINSQMHSN